MPLPFKYVRDRLAKEGKGTEGLAEGEGGGGDSMTPHAAGVKSPYQHMFWEGGEREITQSQWE